jgi:hypothetical protein
VEIRAEGNRVNVTWPMADGEFGRATLNLNSGKPLIESIGIANSAIASRCGWTPYDGMTTTGWPVATILRGSIVMREDAILGAPRGRPLRFLGTLAPIAA